MRAPRGPVRFLAEFEKFRPRGPFAPVPASKLYGTNPSHPDSPALVGRYCACLDQVPAQNGGSARLSRASAPLATPDEGRVGRRPRRMFMHSQR